MKCFMKTIGIMVLGLGIVLATIPAANAQEDEFYLEEITVTAQKRSENQQKVAITMEVVSSEDMRVAGKNDLEKILSTVPGVMLNKAEDGLRISIRGISDDTSSFHGQAQSLPTVAINTDGVYSNRKNTGYGLFDLERVEVLYGPQSTLYASNSPGGIVNIATATPKLGVYEGYGAIEVGNYDLLHTEGAMNVPITDSFAIRAAISTQVRDGYLSNGGDDEDAKSARLRGLYEPSEKFSVMVTGETTKSNNYSFAGVAGFVDEDEMDDPWDTDRLLGDPTDATEEKIYAQVDADLGFGTVTVVPSYAKSDSFGIDTVEDQRLFINYNHNKNETEEKGLEMRIASDPDSFLTWLVGFNYYDSEQLLDQKTLDSEGVIGETRYATMNEESKAIFANMTYPVTEELRATVGVRQSWSDIGVYRVETKIANNYEVELTDYEHSYSDPDFKIGVEYDLSPDTMIYADFSTSYRAQGMTESEQPPPEKLKAYTLGAKNRFFNDRLQLNASAFFYDYENYPASVNVMAYIGDDFDNPMSSDVTNDEPNASTWGEGFMTGIDLQSTLLITMKDVLNVSISYLKTEWTDLYFDFYYDWATDSGVPNWAAPEAIEIYPLEDEDYNGKPMTASPEWNITASYQHTFDLPNGGALVPQVDLLYKGDYRLTWKDDDYPYNYQEAHHKLDLSMNYTHSDGKWSLTAYCRNVGDYAEKRSYFPDPVNESRIGQPRTYGAVLSVRF